ncbi:hypothetical protein Tco_0058863 [Tanacetum coccineum]
MLRAEEKRRKPPTKAQKRNLMYTYLKNMGRYKHNQLKIKSYEEIQKLFDNEIRMEDDKETDEHEEVEVDDDAELKKHLVIVKDDDIAIDAIPLATKPPLTVEYKLLKEGIMAHYQLIRANGSSKRYSSMIRMLQDIDREDLETLWKLVKTKHGDIRPKDEHERVLWGDLKVMFKPDIKSDVWRNLQGYKVTIWKLYDSCGVHFVRFENMLGLNMLVLFAVWAQKTFTTACGNNFEVNIVGFAHEKSRILDYLLELVTKMVIYHLFEDEVEFHSALGYVSQEEEDNFKRLRSSLYIGLGIRSKSRG